MGTYVECNNVIMANNSLCPLVANGVHSFVSESGGYGNQLTKIVAVKEGALIPSID